MQAQFLGSTMQLPSNKIPETGFPRQAVKTVAYPRVSTPQQDVHSQRVDDFIEATASGRASETRRRIDELMSALQPGNRLGRSLGQIVAILDALAKQRVSFSPALARSQSTAGAHPSSARNPSILCG